MSKSFTQNNKIVNALAPLADYADDDPASDVVSLAECRTGVFIIQTGDNAGGNATITVESCDDVTPTTATAIPFAVTKYETEDSDIASTARAAVAAAGFDTSASVDGVMYVIEVTADGLSGSDEYVRVQVTESTDAAVLASILFIGTGCRYNQETMATAIV